MAQIKLRNKTITIDDNLYNEMLEHCFEFDETDCKGLIKPLFTTGDPKSGFSCVDINDVIDTCSEKELSELLTKGIMLQKEVMK